MFDWFLLDQPNQLENIGSTRVFHPPSKNLSFVRPTHIPLGPSRMPPFWDEGPGDFSLTSLGQKETRVK